MLVRNRDGGKAKVSQSTCGIQLVQGHGSPSLCGVWDRKIY